MSEQYPTTDANASRGHGCAVAGALGCGVLESRSRQTRWGQAANAVIRYMRTRYAHRVGPRHISATGETPVTPGRKARTGATETGRAQASDLPTELRTSGYSVQSFRRAETSQDRGPQACTAALPKALVRKPRNFFVRLSGWTGLIRHG